MRAAGYDPDGPRSIRNPWKGIEMQSKVPTDTDERERRRVAELKPGDWVGADAFDDGYPAEVLSVHPYGDKVVVVLAEQDGEPFTQRWPKVRIVRLATADERAVGRALRTRLTVAQRLRDLADLVASTDVPVRVLYGSGAVTFVLDAVTEVERLSKLLDLPIVVDSAGRHSVFWPREAKKGEFRAEWGAYADKGKPADPDAEATP